MSLDRINNRVYGSDKRQSYQSTKANIDLMLKYPRAFDFVRNGKKLLSDLKDIAEKFKREKFLTDKQMSYVNENIYERFWQGLSVSKDDPELQGCPTRHDNKKTLRFG